MAFHVKKSKRATLLCGGVVLGIALSQLLPLAPLHAVATDRQDTLAIATGEVEPGIEAVFMLDFLSGDLRRHSQPRNPHLHGYVFPQYRLRSESRDRQVTTLLARHGGRLPAHQEQLAVGPAGSLCGRIDVGQNGRLQLCLQFVVSQPALDVAADGVAADGLGSHPHHGALRPVTAAATGFFSPNCARALLLGTPCTTILVGVSPLR